MAVGGTREKLSMISTVTNQGRARWMIIDGAFNSDRLIELFEALVKDAPRKVFLILVNLGVHHSKPVNAWLAEHVEQIEKCYTCRATELKDIQLPGDLVEAMARQIKV